MSTVPAVIWPISSGCATSASKTKRAVAHEPYVEREALVGGKHQLAEAVCGCHRYKLLPSSHVVIEARHAHAEVVGNVADRRPVEPDRERASAICASVTRGGRPSLVGGILIH